MSMAEFLDCMMVVQVQGQGLVDLRGESQTRVETCTMRVHWARAVRRARDHTFDGM